MPKVDKSGRLSSPRAARELALYVSPLSLDLVLKLEFHELGLGFHLEPQTLKNLAFNELVYDSLIQVVM